MKTMKHENGYWIDEHGNRWDDRRISKSQAEANSNSLINCTDCTNCANCIFCTDCTCCNGCTACIICITCSGCDSCKVCTKGLILYDCFTLSFKQNWLSKICIGGNEK